MSDSVKPFACTSVGCNMSFVNEDHLTVHKKKHDMMLNLGINNKNNIFIADQTPTPTRFIRNCDEVGLFQDLHNENPFEETFRRAVESGKSGVLNVPEVDENDDTLHTPNIFPHMTEECTTYVSTVSIKHVEVKSQIKNFSDSARIVQIETIKDKNNQEENSKNNEERDKICIDNIQKENETVQTVLDSKSNDSYTAKSDSHMAINGGEMQLLLKTQDGKVLRFVAAPVVESQGGAVNAQTKEQNTTQTKIVPNDYNKVDSKIIQNQKLSIAKMKLKQALTKNVIVIENKTARNNENSNKLIEGPKERGRHADHSKKQAILERNRASSMRARAKRKAWIENLQQSLKLANETNANLHAQMKSLHAQVAKLKTLLLAHKDCPVTKAMEKGNGIVVGSKVLTIKPNEVKQLPVAGSTKPVKRLCPEKLVVPEKKPMILSTLSSPIILPKSDSATNTITLHGVETIKSIPTISIVAPFVTSTDTGKTILGLMHSDSGKVSYIQNTHPISENYNENAASKTTGT